MLVLKSYVTKTIILATAMAGLVMLSLLFVMLLLSELKQIGTGDYGLQQAILFVLLRLPNQLYQFAPMLILIGSIVGLSILSSHKELAVMRAAGFSLARIMQSVLLAATLLILTMMLIGEWLGPRLSNQAEIRKDYLQNAGQAVITATGAWFHIDNNFIHAEHVVGRKLLEDVTRYEFDDNYHLQTTYFAKSLVLKDKHWRMYDVVKTSFYNERTKSEAFAEAPWDLTFNPHLLDVGLVEPGEMSLFKLKHFAHYLEENGLQASEYQFQFWQRLLQPLAALIMVFLAIPFVLGTLSTATLGWRVLAGILCGFSFFILNALLGQLCLVYQIPTLFAALMPLLLFAIIGGILMRKLVRT